MVSWQVAPQGILVGVGSRHGQIRGGQDSAEAESWWAKGQGRGLRSWLLQAFPSHLSGWNPAGVCKLQGPVIGAVSKPSCSLIAVLAFKLRMVEKVLEEEMGCEGMLSSPEDRRVGQQMGGAAGTNIISS